MNHDSAIDILAHHTDGGGLSDHVFAIMYLLGIRFQPRMSSPNDRRLYAFEAKGRYGVLAPFMGEHLDRKLIEANWDDVQRVITAFRNRVVAPSLILRKLGTTPRQRGNGLGLHYTALPPIAASCPYSDQLLATRKFWSPGANRPSQASTRSAATGCRRSSRPKPGRHGSARNRPTWRDSRRCWAPTLRRA